jgi:uncharacterized protein
MPATVLIDPRWQVGDVDAALGFRPEWIAGKIAPQLMLFITTDSDRLVPPEKSERLDAHAKEPKRLVVLKSDGHDAVYTELAFSEVMAATLGWYGQYLPPQWDRGKGVIGLMQILSG